MLFLKYKKQIYFIAAIAFSAISLGVLVSLKAKPPTASHISGFYSESFTLTLSAPSGSEIYYTLDGTKPDKESYRYTGPLTISDSSKNANSNSMRTDVSAGFYTDLIREYETWDEDPQYCAPDYLIDKCTVIRAVAVNRAGIISNEISMTYFVEKKAADYDGCKIISLITDPANLFDPESGIYVTGNSFDAYMSTGEIGNYWRFWEANYRKRGIDWERQGTFHFFDTDGRLILEKQGGMRVHGGVSRGTLPRSLNLYARAEYDYSNVFEADLFGSGFCPHAITLNSGGNQLITQFNDYMMTERVRDRNYATLLMEPYVLFINGEYWGFYWMSEKYDEQYIEYYYGVKEDNCVIIKNGMEEAGGETALRLYNDMVAFITLSDMSLEENYAKACEMIDIDSFLDYYCTMLYIARCEDWPGSNFALWRSRTVSESPYADTKWRWMMFDCNSTSMQDDWQLTTYDTLPLVLETDPVFAALCDNENFCKLVRERVCEIGEDCFEPEEMHSFVADYSLDWVTALQKSWARFYGSENNKMEEYLQTMESVQRFFNGRKVYIESVYKGQ